ncbi:hypothetical protein HB904_04195 [Listeria booriae]|uniref:Uncharacterized protein n=1 Tax=Listeria booriae TaxID=1552123 RepID=A0A842AET2_9LIST|nr:hypothetical protein [Listeria booriae]MBC1615374.1 hypothetical protein [Listeria booriae]
MKVINEIFTFLLSWLFCTIIFGALIFLGAGVAYLFTQQYPVDLLGWVSLGVGFLCAGYSITTKEGDDAK